MSEAGDDRALARVQLKLELEVLREDLHQAERNLNDAEHAVEDLQTQVDRARAALNAVSMDVQPVAW